MKIRCIVLLLVVIGLACGCATQAHKSQPAAAQTQSNKMADFEKILQERMDQIKDQDPNASLKRN